MILIKFCMALRYFCFVSFGCCYSLSVTCDLSCLSFILSVVDAEMLRTEPNRTKLNGSKCWKTMVKMSENHAEKAKAKDKVKATTLKTKRCSHDEKRYLVFVDCRTDVFWLWYKQPEKGKKTKRKREYESVDVNMYGIDREREWEKWRSSHESNLCTIMLLSMVLILRCRNLL